MALHPFPRAPAATGKPSAPGLASVAAIAEKWRGQFWAEGLKAMAEGGKLAGVGRPQKGLVISPDPIPHHDTRKELAALAHVWELYSREEGRRGNGARWVTTRLRFPGTVPSVF